MVQALTQAGGYVGPCLTSGLDPSSSSFEHARLSQINAKLFRRYRLSPEDLMSSALDCFSMSNPLPGSLGTDSMEMDYQTSLAVEFNSHQPWVIKEPRLVTLWQAWEAFWENSSLPIMVIGWLRHPRGWLQSVTHHARLAPHVHIPTEPDYLYGLWVEYAQRLMCFAGKLAPNMQMRYSSLEAACRPDGLVWLRDLDWPGWTFPDRLDASRIGFAGRDQGCPASVLSIWERWQKYMVQGTHYVT